MANTSIVVMDSGVGGLPYFSRVRELLPAEYIDYVADTANFPYGDRSDDEVVAAVVSTVARVVASLHPDIIVVACNTASVLALDELRRTFATPFVGVVPAVKPACRSSVTRSVGVLATERTISGGYLDDLVTRHCSNCSVTRIAAGSLVTYVERSFGDSDAPSVAQVAAPYVERLQSAGVDTVVLGCTHFVYLAAALAEAVGLGCRVIDSRDGVARQTARVVAELSADDGECDRLESADATESSLSGLYVTGDYSGRRYRRLASAHGISRVQRLPNV